MAVAWRKSVIIGILSAVAAVIVSWIWTSKGSGYHGYDGLIIGLAAFVALVAGIALSFIFFASTSAHNPHRVRDISIAFTTIIGVLLLLYFTNWI